MRRFERLFCSDGKIVIVALDHGLGLPVLPALNNTGELLKKVADGGADAVLTSFGVAQRYEREMRGMKLILRLDGGSSMLPKNPSGSRLYTVEDAVRLGADAVVCMGFPGASNEKESLQNLAWYASEAQKWGIPLVAEMLPGGFEGTLPMSVDNIKWAARLGAESGAHVIKTAYAGSAEEYSAVVKGSFVPVVILGGAASKDLMGLVQVVEQAMESGVAGVAIGRNVWNNKSPEKVTRALVDLVHNGKKVKDILPLIE